MGLWVSWVLAMVIAGAGNILLQFYYCVGFLELTTSLSLSLRSLSQGFLYQFHGKGVCFVYRVIRLEDEWFTEIGSSHKGDLHFVVWPTLYCCGICLAVVLINLIEGLFQMHMPWTVGSFLMPLLGFGLTRVDCSFHVMVLQLSVSNWHLMFIHDRSCRIWRNYLPELFVSSSNGPTNYLSQLKVASL